MANLPHRLRVWLRQATDLLYPRRCYGCEARLGHTDNLYLCHACWRKLPLMRDGMCLRCGMPLGPKLPHQEQCSWCSSQKFAFGEVRTAGQYEASLRKLILDLKFHQLTQLATPLAAAIFWQIARTPFVHKPQAIVPVPLSDQSYLKRGYNQSELLAHSLAHRLNLPCYPKALGKVKETKPQAELDHAGRKANLQAAFRITDAWHIRRLSGQVVLLIDDIVTTGSTAHECAAVLKRQAGAANVCVAAIARAV